jgi:L-alanine-DL-glutamate epimerase-like enolase superfamily enzyme
VQLDASIPNFLVQEHNEVNDTRDGGRTVIGAGYLRDPFVVGDDGCVEVPNAPGLGVEIDEAGMARIMAKPWSTQRGKGNRWREPLPTSDEDSPKRATARR